MQLCFLDAIIKSRSNSRIFISSNLDIEGHNVTPWYDNENEKSQYLLKSKIMIQIYKNCYKN